MNSPRQNPFVGLRPFESEDSLYYFGRGEHVKALLEQLYAHRFIAVVGSSGSGKSSLVRAGLIPHLEAGFLVQDRDLWRIAKMKPGDAPLDNLAQVLQSAVGYRDDIDRSLKTVDPLPDPEFKRPVNSPAADELRAGSDDLAALLRGQGAKAALDFLQPALDRDDANLLLLVDQFEEIFRFSTTPEKQAEAADFVALLLRLAGQTETPIFVCLTMRSDFLGDCDAFHGLPEAMNKSQFLVPRLTRSQRREAITGPIHLSGASISNRLLDRLLNENIDTRDDLPVLQHAMMRTWAEWAEAPNGSIDVPHYEKIGTIHTALNQHANEALAELTEEQQEYARILFQAITETDAGNRRIRRPCHLSEISAISGASPQALREIIQKFRENGRSFLVLSSENPNDDPLVDISHESLIRQWETLSSWVELEAESARIYRRLAETALLRLTGRAGLFHDADLEVALDWQEKQKPTIAWAKRYPGDLALAYRFLEDSKHFAEVRREEVEKQRQERERLLMERAEQQRKSLRQTRVFAGIILIFLVLALFAAWAAIQNSWHAERQSLTANYNLAKAFEEKALSELNKASDPELDGSYRTAWAYAVAALQQEIAPESTALQPATIGKLFDTAVMQTVFAEKWSSPTYNLDGSVNAVAFNPNNSHHLAYASSDGIHLRDLSTGKEIRAFEGHSDGVNSVAFSPDGKTLASASSDSSVKLWEVATGKEIRSFVRHSGGVRSVAFSPDGKTLASASDDRSVKLWEVDTGKEIRAFEGHSDGVNSVAFSPDGKSLVSGSYDRSVKLWEVASGQEIRAFAGHSGGVNSVAFSPDGKTLASGSSDDSVKLWEVATGKEIRSFKGHSGGVRSVAFSPDGKTLASASSDSSVKLWEVDTGKEIRAFEGHSDRVNSVAFSPDGKTLASASEDSSLKLWEVATGKEIRSFYGHSSWVRSVAFSPDGKTLASSGHGLKLLEVATGKEIRRFEGHSSYANYVVFSPDGKTLASASHDRSVKLWEVVTGKEIRRLKGHSHWVYSVAFSPDSKTLASASYDRSVKLWEVDTGKEIRAFEGHSGEVFSVAFSPDGKTLASASNDRSLKLWEVATGKEIRAFEGHSGEVFSVAFSPDGKTLASASEDSSLKLWEVATGKEIRSFYGHSSRVRSVAFSPDGKILASGSNDDSVKLWEVASGKEIQSIEGQFGGVNSVAFSPDGKTLASGLSYSHTVKLWEVATGKEIRNFEGHSESVYSVAFSPDGKTLASGSSDYSVKLWDVASGKEIRSFESHSIELINYVSSVAFSPDGETLASGSTDHGVQLWKVASAKEIRSFEWSSRGVSSVAFSPDGKTLASDSEDNGIELWEISSFYTFVFVHLKDRIFWHHWFAAIQFLWELQLAGHELKPEPRQPTLFAQEGYNFEYEPKFRPLLDPPAPGQSKFEQILAWVEAQQAMKK